MLLKVESDESEMPGKFVRIRPDEYDIMVNRLTDFFAPKQNSSYERYVFRHLSQEKNKSIGMFELRLREHAERCDFGDQLDSNIRDQITAMCASDLLRRKILEHKTKLLEKIMAMARSIEAASVQQKVFDQNSNQNHVTEEVCKIDSRSKFKFHSKNSAIECNRCGIKGHKALDPKCPAKGKSCLDS